MFGAKSLDEAKATAAIDNIKGSSYPYAHKYRRRPALIASAVSVSAVSVSRVSAVSVTVPAASSVLVISPQSLKTRR